MFSFFNQNNLSLILVVETVAKRFGCEHLPQDYCLWSNHQRNNTLLCRHRKSFDWCEFNFCPFSNAYICLIFILILGALWMDPYSSFWFVFQDSYDFWYQVWIQHLTSNAFYWPLLIWHESYRVQSCITCQEPSREIQYTQRLNERNFSLLKLMFYRNVESVSIWNSVWILKNVFVLCIECKKCPCDIVWWCSVKKNCLVQYYLIKISMDWYNLCTLRNGTH